MPGHSVVERSRIAFSITIFLETAPGEAANSEAHGKAQTLGGQPGRTIHGIGPRTCTAVLVPLQRVFGRYSGPPGCGGNRGGRRRV